METDDETFGLWKGVRAFNRDNNVVVDDTVQML
jgi:hypothetical protein